MKTFLSLILIFQLSFDILAQVRLKETISLNNEFGGETISHNKEDFSREIIYYDLDGNIAKEEIIFTSDYPIDNNLNRIVTHYYFGKKTREEKIYSQGYTLRTLIEKSIDHYDRNTGQLEKSENHFISPYRGFNIIYRKNNKKHRIEWYYPDNIDGTSLNVVYFNDDEQAYKTETFFTEKTTRESGIQKRIYFSSYNSNKYMRKTRQEWYYTDEFAANNERKALKVEYFHYSLGKPVRIETVYFDQQGEYLGH